MNDPGFFITLGVVVWLLLVACFVLHFGWMYKNPRKAWERWWFNGEPKAMVSEITQPDRTDHARSPPTPSACR